MNAFTDFEILEDGFQSEYDKIELPFSPNTIVEVELLGFRGITVGLSDWVDKPDPQFHLICRAIRRPHLRRFKTKTIGSDITSGFVGETFRYVIPNDYPDGKPFPIEIELYDIDYGPDDYIGKDVVETSSIPDDGTEHTKTLKFGETGQNGELDIKLRKMMKRAPDFRYSLGLCDEEKAFRKKRLPIVHEAMKKLLGDNGPKSLLETPIVSFVGSGGGYRAVVGMCGAMEALKDAGLLDVFTYSCGLSGSSWYLACAYILHGMKESEQKSYHDTLRKSFEDNLVADMINPFTFKAYMDESHAKFTKYGQPHTFVNYFPGFMVGKHILGEKMSMKLSDMASYVEDALVPYPLLVALQVKNKMKASQYHAYVERSPYEISIPSYGINVNPKHELSTWHAGYVVREVPELPIYFTIGMTGCAFSILLNSFLANGGELSKDFSSYLEKQRLEGKKNASKTLEETNRTANIESEDEEDDDDDDAELTMKNLEESDVTETNALDLAEELAEESQELPFIRKKIRNSRFFTTRNALVGRTAQVFNVALGLEKVKRHFLNPLTNRKTIETGKARDIIEECGMIHDQKNISTKKNILSYADAGILKNVPTDVVLRPQRTTELMIVMDFNAYASDENFNYEPLLSAAAHAWQSGLEFPQIDFKKITNMPPKEFLIFPSDGPKCPTVLWFTLCNKNFKNLEDYVPRSDAPPPNKQRKFNDFQVFGQDTNFSTFSFQYSNYHFDQLRELMYHNVSSHVEEIKEALHEAILKKRNKEN